MQAQTMGTGTAIHNTLSTLKHANTSADEHQTDDPFTFLLLLHFGSKHANTSEVNIPHRRPLHCPFTPSSRSKLAITSTSEVNVSYSRSLHFPSPSLSLPPRDSTSHQSIFPIFHLSSIHHSPAAFSRQFIWQLLPFRLRLSHL